MIATGGREAASLVQASSMAPLIEVRGVTKRFAGVLALSDIDFDVRPGEVHALMGENGAGKSTLMKILSGIYAPDSGSISLGGQTAERHSPTHAKSFGLRLIYQELSVIDHLSVAENLFVGTIPTRRWLGIPIVDRAAMRDRAVRALARVGLDVDPATLVGDLSISGKQQVEIAKALVADARVIIMDEPTSSLTEGEVQHLFKVIHELRQQGLGIVYISHKLKEIPLVADRVSVLKDGRHVGTFDARTTPPEQLVSAMVGRDIGHERPRGELVDRTCTVFSVNGLSSADGRVNDVSFDLHRGEILGFAGLIGAGRSELMETIFGARARSAGAMVLNERSVQPKTPYHAVKAGIAFVTEDRRRTGFFGNFSIAQNISSLSLLKSAAHRLSLERIDFDQERAVADDFKDRLRIRCASTAQNIGELSGGNQQKAIIAKWLAAGSDLFIFDEPTRGIDIGAKSEIHQIMRRLANDGKGVLMVSSELPELLGVCDRIAVFRQGGIAGILDNAEATEEKIMLLATT